MTGLRLLIAAGAVTVGAATIIGSSLVPSDGKPADTVTIGPSQTGPPLQEQQPEPEKPEKPEDQQVSGKVLDRDGKVVDRAEVRFAGRKKQTVFTNALGEFTFRGPAGAYTVTVRVGSREKRFDNVQIEGNQLRPDTLVIEPEGESARAPER